MTMCRRRPDLICSCPNLIFISDFNGVEHLEGLGSGVGLGLGVGGLRGMVGFKGRGLGVGLAVIIQYRECP